MEKYACSPVYAWISVHHHQMPPAQQSLPTARCVKGVKTIGRRGKKRGGREGERESCSEGRGGEGRERMDRMSTCFRVLLGLVVPCLPEEPACCWDEPSEDFACTKCLYTSLQAHGACVRVRVHTLPLPLHLHCWLTLVMSWSSSSVESSTSARNSS
jgi:hypothetical protein